MDMDALRRRCRRISKIQRVSIIVIRERMNAEEDIIDRVEKKKGYYCMVI